MRYLCLVAFIAMGCGRPGDVSADIPPDWHPELRPIIIEFAERMKIPYEELYKLRTAQLRSPVDTISDTHLGICYRYNGVSDLYIDSNLSEPDRRVVGMHELGHCLLNLDHDMDAFVMYPEYSTGRTEPITEAEINGLYADMYRTRGRQGR